MKKLPIRWSVKSIILPAILCGWVVVQGGCLSLSDLREGQRINTVLREYKAANMDEGMELIKELGNKRDLASLYAICDAYPNDSWGSAGTIVCLLSPAKAVHFCRTLTPISRPWQDAVSSLRSHPKEKVITYFVELAQSPEPLVRAYCYQTCMRQPEWKELISFAEKDVDSKIPFSIPGPGIKRFLPDYMEETKTVGQIAREYLDCCAGKAPLAKIGDISKTIGTTKE